MSSRLYVRVSPAADALDRFEAAWHLATGRAAPAPLAILSFADLPLLLKTLTPARWALLKKLRVDGPSSIFGLAKSLGRDYKNVYMDTKQLISLNLIEQLPNGAVRVAWDAVRAELRL